MLGNARLGYSWWKDMPLMFTAKKYKLIVSQRLSGIEI